MYIFCDIRPLVLSQSKLVASEDPSSVKEQLGNFNKEKALEPEGKLSQSKVHSSVFWTDIAGVCIHTPSLVPRVTAVQVIL